MVLDPGSGLVAAVRTLSVAVLFAVIVLISGRRSGWSG